MLSSRLYNVKQTASSRPFFLNARVENKNVKQILGKKPKRDLGFLLPLSRVQATSLRDVGHVYSNTLVLA